MPSVVLLLSDKRSGSTMFQDEFCRHPSVQTVPYSPHSNLETHWWLMAAVVLKRPPELFSFSRVYRGYGNARNARAYMIALLERCVPDFIPPTDDRALVFEGWEALCRNLARPVFFEKSPQFIAHWSALSLMLEWMERTDFEVKVIGLVRNPHGTIYSAAALFGSDPKKRQFGWLANCRNLLSVERMLPPDQFMRMRYEDLVASPNAGFAALCSFVGLESHDALGSGAHTGSSQKWRRDPSYDLELDTAVRQMARHFGYDDAELDNLKDKTKVASGSLRRRSYRITLNRMRDRFAQPMFFRLKNSIRSAQNKRNHMN